MARYMSDVTSDRLGSVVEPSAAWSSDCLLQAQHRTRTNNPFLTMVKMRVWQT